MTAREDAQLALDRVLIDEEFIQSYFDSKKPMGINNWPDPNGLDFDLVKVATYGGASYRYKIDEKYSFTREQYAKEWHIVTRYECAAQEAITAKSWKTSDKKGRWKLIFDAWKKTPGKKGDLFPNINSPQTLWERYYRNSEPSIGALQKITAMLEEFISKTQDHDSIEQIGNVVNDIEDMATTLDFSGIS